MKFVPASWLKAGMVLERDLYLFQPEGPAMLKAGTTLSEHYIERLKELEVAGVYIRTSSAQPPRSGGDVLLGYSMKTQLLEKIRQTYESVTRTVPERIHADSIEPVVDVAGRLVDMMIASPDILVNLEDLRVYDDSLYNHSLGVSVLSVSVGLSFSMTRDDLKELALSALLHDIGKMMIPKELLHKRARLTKEEFEIMKKHAALGADFLASAGRVSGRVIAGLRHHHERVDGSGYPCGLKKDEIHLFARIISVADVYDALTSLRPYRAPASPAEAVEYLMGGSGKMFDINVVSSFLKRVSPFPVGSCVRLSNGEAAIVIRQNQENPLRPMVRLCRSRQTAIDLYRSRGAQHLVVLGLYNAEPVIS